MNPLIFKYHLYESIPFINKNGQRRESARLKVRECLDKKIYEAIPALIAAGAPKERDVETFLHGPTFSFLLDKCIETISKIGKKCVFEGGSVASNGYLLLEALSCEYANIASLSHYSQCEQKALRTIYERLMLALSLAIYWDVIADESEVAEDLNNLQGKVMTLVFSGHNEHAAHFSIEKGNFTIFNKGDGRWRHHNQGHARQCFFSKNMQGPIDIHILNQLVEAKQQSNIDFLYGIADLLPNSQLEDPSLLEHDYSQGQLQGSCSAHSLLAFFRYYLRREVEGSDLHKQGVYKEHKARLLLSMFSTHEASFHPELSFLIKEKLELFRCELELLEAAKNMEQFEELLNAMEVDVVPVFKTIHERYAFLRIQIKKNPNDAHAFSSLLKVKRKREDAYLQQLLEECDDLDEREEFLKKLLASGSRYTNVV